MFLVIEAGLVTLVLGAAFLAPNLGSRWFQAIERNFGKLAERKGLSVLVVGVTALALRAALLPILPVPQPAVHDEFGYLLLSDTFAHGRLTNPTNPMWVHFESFFVIWRPTYTTKYWPAQGLIMALGQVITGQPFWGVWLSVGLMCAAITWMLQAWLEPGWALLGGFLAVIRFGTFNYWANSYFGGAVAAIGGALVLGALPRLRQQKRVRHALLMGLGFAIIANSRPYEGLFFGIPVAVALLVWLWKMRRSDLRRALKRVMAPLLAVLALTLFAMGYYFWRTTGTPFNTPYLVYAHAYEPVPYFPWQSIKRIPTYHFAMFKTYFVGHDLYHYENARRLAGLPAYLVNRLVQIWSFYFGIALTIPFVLLTATVPYGFSWRDISPKTRFLLVVSGMVILGNMLPVYYEVHYSAAITSAIFALVMIALRQIRLWKLHGKPIGVSFVRAVPSACLVLFLFRAVAGPFHLPIPPVWPKPAMLTWCSLTPSNTARAAVLKKLRQYSGRQLVIVHYSKGHDIYFNEWVYNRADLNSAKVIWARDMGLGKNQELIRYFKHRHVWLVDADDRPPRLLPYSEAADRESATSDK